MKIAIVTDAWSPQVNGVVTTLQRTVAALEQLGHEVAVLSPDGHRTIPCPTYPEIRLALWPGRRARRRARRARARRDSRRDRRVRSAWRRRATASRAASRSRPRITRSFRSTCASACRSRRSSRMRCCGGITRRRAARSSRRSSSGASSSRKVSATSCCGRAASTPSCFGRAVASILPLPRPIFAYLGPRRGREEHRRRFLELDLPGTKVVIGDGPDRPLLEKRYPSAVFLGFKFGVELAQALVVGRRVRVSEPHRHVRARDARGDGLRHARRGVSRHGADRRRRARSDGRARRGSCARPRSRRSPIDREGCRRAAGEWTWQRATAQFLSHLVRARDGEDLAPARRESMG